MQSFLNRHIGTRQADIESMLQTIGFDSLDGLIDATVPRHIRLKSPLEVCAPLTEQE